LFDVGVESAGGAPGLLSSSCAAIRPRFLRHFSAFSARGIALICRAKVGIFCDSGESDFRGTMPCKGIPHRSVSFQRLWYANTQHQASRPHLLREKFRYRIDVLEFKEHFSARFLWQPPAALSLQPTT
jgi:hypothetical protein